MSHEGAVTVEQIIDRIDAWRGRPASIRPLTSGLTNANYRVDVGGRSFVVRIPGASTELLAIDRGNELHSARVAAALGIGPAVLHHFPDCDATVVEFLHGRPMTNDRLREPGMPVRIAATLRLLHGGPRFLRDFDMLRLAEGYRGVAESRGFPMPPGYAARRAAIERIRAVLAIRPLPGVPCHNDLLADNYIEQPDGRLRLVDWEYSGNGDPAFELGNTCRELDYDDARLEELCRAYFGETPEPLTARVRLHMIVSDVGWALWAVIQAGISRIAFDFAGYGTARWTRAEATMDSPEFPRWLGAVGRSPEARLR
jgi:aminoglycoside phosphotransferase (APT) family kinase protein